MVQHHELLTKKALMVPLFLWLNAIGAQARIGIASKSLPTRFLATNNSNSCYPDVQRIKIESTTGLVVSMFEVQAMSSGVNVALGKTATQSSTYGTRDALFAVDGDVTTFSHTAADDVNSWWEVDFGQTISTESIYIKNRWCVDSTDPNECLCRLSGAVMSLIDGQGEVIRTETIGDTCGVYDLNFDLSSSSCTENPPTVVDSCYPDARKIRLESTTGQVVSMFEMQAMSGSENIALGKTATQSSTYGTKEASFALDGNVTTFSHTAADDVNSWWEVDLGQTISTESIHIKNRWCVNATDPNECLCRLSGSVLSLLDENDEVIRTKSIGDTCGVYDLDFHLSSTCSEDPEPADSCYPNARIVKLQSTTGEAIQMFEVQAMSLNTNVALGKAASQSSTYATKFAFLASDGDETTFSHTGDADVSPWWQVDLGATVSTESILIKNRWCQDESDPTNCLCRLTGAILSLTNELGQVVATEIIGDTCGVHELSFDMSTCTSSPTNEPTTFTPPPTNKPSSVGTPSIKHSEAVIVGDDSFSIDFTNPLANTEIYAAVIGMDNCANLDSSQVDMSTENVASGSSIVTVSQNINDLITAEDRNSGSVHLKFCLRADVWAADFPSSLLASKVSVGITVSFDKDSTISSGFQLAVQTADFSETSVDYTTGRGVDISAILGDCASPGSDGPYGIGSTLRFCLKSDAADVVISSLSNVSFTDVDGNPILGIVDSSGEPSIVTNIAGLNSKAVDVATMMATAIYDQGFGGQTINVQGKVLVSYINGTGRRQLQSVEEKGEQPFSIQINLDESAEKEFHSSPSTNHVFGTTLTTILIAGLVTTLFVGGLVLVSCDVGS